MANLKVVIVGAGVVGASCARSLAREGAEVVVLEQGEAAGVRGATAAGMGHITVNGADEASIQLCILGRRMWREDAPPISEEDGFVEIGVGHDHHGALAAQLQRHRDQLLGGGAVDDPARLHRSGESDLGEVVGRILVAIANRLLEVLDRFRCVLRQVSRVVRWLFQE